MIIDLDHSFMSTSREQICQDLFRYWEYISTEVKPFFVRTVALIGGESSGNSTMANKLANIFNTTSAREHGRDYVFTHLGGDEMALQYSDYDKIALGQAQFIDFAVRLMIDAPTDRDEFQRLLEKLLHGNQIPYVRVDVADYDQRFLQCITLVKELLGEG